MLSKGLKENAGLYSGFLNPQSSCPVAAAAWGCIELKLLCIQNLYVEAHKEEDIKLLEEVLNDAKEVFLVYLRKLLFIIFLSE